jgi:inner membrane protein
VLPPPIQSKSADLKAVSSRSHATTRRPGHAELLAIALVGTVLALDLLWAVISDSTSSVAYVILDWPAHLATCLLLLMGLTAVSRSPRPAVFAAGAVVATFAIDADHIPNYLGWHGLTGGEPRPYPHSLLMVGVLMLIAGLSRGRLREATFGAAFGVGVHLLRDLATGPGVALLWPLSSAAVTVPYVIFATGLALAAAVVVSRGTTVRSPSWIRRLRTAAAP